MEVQRLSTSNLASVVLTAGCVVITLAGCAHRIDLPRDPADIPGYHLAPAELAHEDVAALAGRRIVVDPGHGGFFPGAVGDGGLTEAEVNLGVALYLQGLLQWAGADVHLTRTADVDFLTPADSSLTADLSVRMALVDSLRPDVFLSIHHNSTASRDPEVNETQTYYPLGREGADRDLALAIHRQLVQALEIEPARILPGGFHVLRNSPVPAVLGEPAMISNPVMEGRLSLARSLELEARAYFLGLRDYFAAGSPRWLTEHPDTLDVAGEVQELHWRFEPGDPVAPGLDPASVTLRIDGRVADLAGISPDGLAYTASVPTTSPRTTVELRGRNLRGRTAASSHLLQRADLRREPPTMVGRQRLPAGDGSGRTWVEADGMLPILRDASGQPPWPADQHPAEPAVLLPGLKGRRIAIDPRGGGTDHRTLGPLGTRGSDLNLTLAERLAALLRGAGARVLLVRDDDLHTPEPARLARASAFDAEFYLTIDRGVPAIKHHPGSLAGRPWAQHLAHALDPLLADTVAVLADHDHVLRHTACPAVVVVLEALTGSRWVEDRVTDPAWQDAVARALFRGLVALTVPDASWLTPTALLADLGPRAIAQHDLDHVRLDGNFTWLMAPGRRDGNSLASSYPGDPGLPILGPHHVLELHHGPLWQVWTLVRQPTGNWHGQLFLENR